MVSPSDLAALGHLPQHVEGGIQQDLRVVLRITFRGHTRREFEEQDYRWCMASKQVGSIGAVQLPIDWTAFGWSESPRFGEVTLTTGDPKWSWNDAAPALPIHVFETAPGSPVESFDVDHVVVLVPDLDGAVASFSHVGLEPRLRMKVGGRPAAFFRAGPLIEVIESPVRQASIYGLALSTDLSLETVSLEWASRGLTLGEIKPAIQQGRRIMTVHSIEAGFALMSYDRDVHMARET